MHLMVRFRGRVQGVGFRVTARSIAEQHKLPGWVRNEPDGSVLLAIEGNPQAIDAFLGDLRTTTSSLVSSLERTELPHHSGYVGFEIRR